MALAAGSRVGAYQVLGSLGAGGMGEVYRARDERLGREVALKILPAGVATDGERLARFDREARALASLNHLHVAQLYGVEESGPTRALVMELVPGETLAERIARGPIPLGEALTIARQVAEALDAVHEEGVLHRDLKPANIKLRPDGVAKVLDFGLAKVLTDEPRVGEDTPLTLPEAETRPGTVLGTTAYMSPEQARGHPLDRRSDIWSFGCVLYEMLARRRAFPGDTRSDTIAAVLERSPDWSALPRTTPPHVHRLLRHCLEKDARRRLRDIGDALHELASDADPASVAAPIRLPPYGSRALLPWAAAFAVIGAGITALWLWPRADRAPSASLAAVPLTSYPGFESHPSLSPDGNQVAFTWNGEREDNFDVYVKLVGPGTPLRLTSDPSVDTTPAWSPDGRWIAFLRALQGGRAAVLLVPALGGPERRLGEVSPAFFFGPDIGPWLCWSLDSAWLIVSDRPSPAEPGGLFSWSVSTGERRRLTSLPPAASFDVAPALSPDSRSLAFTRSVGFGISDLYLLPLDDALQPMGEPKRLTALNRYTASPAWMPHGREIVFSSGSLTGGAVSLFAVDSTAGAGRQSRPRRLTSIGEHAGLVSISHPAGGRSRMVYVQSHFDPGIWQVALPDGEGKALVSQSVPFLLSTRPEYQPQYSPDGQRVAFVSAASGESEIWTCDKDGANLVQLTTAGWPEAAAPRWSPDGSQITFHARPDGPGDIFAIPASGGAPKRVTDDPADDWGASWSPDGRWIYFTSNRSGRSEIWKTPSSGGAAVRVSPDGGLGPTVSPDGQYAYYPKRSGELWRIPVHGGDESRILESVGDWSRIAVTAAGIYFTPPRPTLLKTTDYTIEFFSFSNQQVRTVARLEKPPFLGLTVSPDGRRLLYTQIDQSGTDLMLVEDIR